jgi:peptidoglycan/xylan/chitin deacetylase (PgdA/CDA1 family)
VIRTAAKAVLTSAAHKVALLPMTRRAMHRLSVAARGPSVAFLRVRRVLPDSSAGTRHIDRLMGGGLLQSELDAQLVALSKTLRFVHPGEALAALERGERLDGSACVLTFDESFAATAELALPVLEKHRVPALFFVTTAFLDGDVHHHPAHAPTDTTSIDHAVTYGTLWDQAVHTALEATAPRAFSVPWMDRVLRTDSAERRATSVRRLLLSMVALDPNHLRGRLDDLYGRLDDAPSPPQLDRMLSGAELERLARHSLVSVGAHGHRHFALSSLSDEVLKEELERPRAILRERAGVAFCDVASYPFGRPPYFDDRVVMAAREAGYRAALTAVPGVARPGDHLFSLPRLPMGPKAQAAEAYELQGVSSAVDELLLVATGAKDRVVAELEG